MSEFSGVVPANLRRAANDTLSGIPLVNGYLPPWRLQLLSLMNYLARFGNGPSVSEDEGSGPNGRVHSTSAKDGLVLSANRVKVETKGGLLATQETSCIATKAFITVNKASYKASQDL